MAESLEWLRVRGLGRERFATYVADYLVTLGYRVEREETAEPASIVRATLERLNPAVPPSAHELRFRVGPTSGGGALVWEAPTSVPTEERSRMDRFVREFSGHLERSVLTESHGTARIVKPSTSRLPWAGAESRPAP
jgi:hypothetical protein